VRLLNDNKNGNTNDFFSKTMASHGKCAMDGSKLNALKNQDNMLRKIIFRNAKEKSIYQ